MAALTQPTGTEIVQFLAGASGEVQTVGTMTATTIDALIARDTDANPVTRAFEYISSLFDDPLTLTVDEYRDAWPAMHYAIRYELLGHDKLAQAAIPNAQGGGILIEAYEAQMKFCAEQCGLSLKNLGINSSRYHTFDAFTVERIGGAEEINSTTTWHVQSI